MIRHTNMQARSPGISTISQAAATAALNGPQDLLKERARRLPEAA